MSMGTNSLSPCEAVFALQKNCKKIKSKYETKIMLALQVLGTPLRVALPAGLAAGDHVEVELQVGAGWVQGGSLAAGGCTVSPGSQLGAGGSETEQQARLLHLLL